MDFHKEVLDTLRAKGRAVGAPYIQDGAGLFVVIDDVAVPIGFARELAEGRMTLTEIAAHVRRSRPEVA